MDRWNLNVHSTRLQFNFIYAASVTVSVVSEVFTETYGVTPNKRQRQGKLPKWNLCRTRVT